MIPLAKPNITDEDREAVMEVLRGTTLSCGPKLKQFEEACAKLAGRKYAVGVSSGTAALHLAVKALGIGPGDEVITTPYTFVATVNAILYEGATPVFVDEMGYGRGQTEAAITHRTKAAIAVSLFGNVFEVADVAYELGDTNVKLIEDACESVGGHSRGRPSGNFGEVSTFAFYPNKQVTTGEGGMVLTDDILIASKCDGWRNHGRHKEQQTLLGTSLGYNYRMDEMSAALGLSQIGRIDEKIAKRKAVAAQYTELLPAYLLIKPHTSSGHAHFAYIITPKYLPGYPYLEIDDAAGRDKLIELMAEEGIECGNYFPLVTTFPHIRQYATTPLPSSERASARSLALPMFETMTEDEVQQVCDALKKCVGKL